MHCHVYFSTIHAAKPGSDLTIRGWIDKEKVHICIVENYAAFKNKEILSFGATWMKLEDIIESVNKPGTNDKFQWDRGLNSRDLRNNMLTTVDYSQLQSTMLLTVLKRTDFNCSHHDPKYCMCNNVGVN